jgi:hypothetical protein
LVLKYFIKKTFCKLRHHESADYLQTYIDSFQVIIAHDRPFQIACLYAAWNQIFCNEASYQVFSSQANLIQQERKQNDPGNGHVVGNGTTLM